MGEGLENWKNLELPEAMYLTRKFREVAVAYEEAKADPAENATLEQYIAAQIAITQWAVTQIEVRLLALEGVDVVPPDWQPPAV